MSTTTVPTTPEIHPQETTKKAPISLTPNAISKVKEIMGQQTPVPAGLRIGVVGGGCSGFSYSIGFEYAPGMMDKTFVIEGLKGCDVAISMMYLYGCIDRYVESLEGSGLNIWHSCG